MNSKSELIRTPYQIIDDYLFDNLKIKSDLNNFNDLIIKNNDIIYKLTDEIKELYKQNIIIKSIIMEKNIRKNHINIQIRLLQKKIVKLNNYLFNEKRRKYKLLLVILNNLLFNYLSNLKDKNRNEDLIFLSVIAIRENKYYLIPNVNNDIFLELLYCFLKIIKNNIIINFDINNKIKNTEQELINYFTNKIYKINYT
jgi:hypothetical protein